MAAPDLVRVYRFGGFQGDEWEKAGTSPGSPLCSHRTRRSGSNSPLAGDHADYWSHHHGMFLTLRQHHRGGFNARRGHTKPPRGKFLALSWLFNWAAEESEDDELEGDDLQVVEKIGAKART